MTRMRAAWVTIGSGGAYATGTGLARASSGRLGRKADREGRPPAGLALDVDPPFQRPGDLLADGEPEPRSLPVRLGGEEGLEDTALHVRSHPGARVGDAQDEILPFAMRLHLEASAIGHRVDRVRDQVGEEVSHEPRIGPDLRGPSVDLPLDLDLRSSLGAKGEIERLVHQRLDLDLLRRGGESASLVEKPADDLRHPLHLAADDLHLRARLLAQIRATGEKLDVAADGVERIAV